MALVDDGLGPDGVPHPLVRGREREAVRGARTGSCAGRHGRRPPVLATEERLDAEVTLPDGQEVRLHGYADRLEIDADGRVVVVDLKTGKYPPTDKALPSNPQLGLYQLAVDNGAADALVGRRRSPGVPSSCSCGCGDELPKVQPQPPQPDVDGATTVQRQLMRPPRAVRDEVLVGASRADPAISCDVRADLPGQGGGIGAVVTDVSIDTADQLRELMRSDFTFSDQQFAAITAPLAPAVVIAGAGSGKTTVMAARVVWLVATGQVAPAEVLGLTFTTKATAELDAGSGSRCGPGCSASPATAAGRPRARDDDEVEEPTVATYHSYAAGLLTEHGLRIGHEPDTRLIADASRYQLAARAIARHRAPCRTSATTRQAVIAYLLALDARDDRAPGRRPTTCAASTPPTARSSWRGWRARPARPTATQRARRSTRSTAGPSCSAWSRPTARLKRDLGLIDFSDQIALAARLARDQPEVGGSSATKYKVVLLDEYQDTSVAQALMLSRLFSGPDAGARSRPPGHRGRRPQPGDLRLARRVGLQHPRSSPVVPGGRRSAATYPLTVNRRSDARILAPPTTSRRRCTRVRPGSCRSSRSPTRGPARSRPALHETYDDELAALGEVCGGPCRRCGARRGARSGC